MYFRTEIKLLSHYIAVKININLYIFAINGQQYSTTDDTMVGF